MGMSYDTPSYSAPAVETVTETTPAKQPTKSVSAGASAAAEAQQQRAKKNRGLVSSILTTRGGSLESSSDANKKSATLG